MKIRIDIRGLSFRAQELPCEKKHQGFTMVTLGMGISAEMYKTPEWQGEMAADTKERRGWNLSDYCFTASYANRHYIY